MEQIRLIMLVESRIRGNVYVRFGGEFLKTSHSNMERRWELSLLVWKPTLTGRKLNDSDKTLQKAYVFNLLANSGFTLPKALSGQALALTADSPIHFDRLCACEEMPRMSLPQLRNELANPVGGFEQVPREMFSSTPSLTPADMFARLQQVRTLLVSRRGSGSSQDRAHYEYLLRIIDSCVK